jgi:hypothetical protein
MKDWKSTWSKRKMDQLAREEKRQSKKRQHKGNRRAGKEALRDGDYDAALEWKDLEAE